MVQGSSVADESCSIYAEDMVGIEFANNCGVGKSLLFHRFSDLGQIS